MSYQSCRWYDPYPRLAFALKLLYLAPNDLQARAAQELQMFLQEHWGMQEAHVQLPGKRWYDEDRRTAQTVELIKNTPEALKTRVADKLLAILSGDPGAASGLS